MFQGSSSSGRASSHRLSSLATKDITLYHQCHVKDSNLSASLKPAQTIIITAVENKKRSVLKRLQNTLSDMRKEFAGHQVLSSDEHAWEMHECSLPSIVARVCKPLLSDMIHYWPTICDRANNSFHMTLNCQNVRPQLVIRTFVLVMLAILQHEQVQHKNVFDIDKTTKIVVRREKEDWIDYGYGPMAKPGAATQEAYPDIFKPTWCYGLGLSQKAVNKLLRSQPPAQ